MSSPLVPVDTLAGLTAAVTGSTSGIGRAIALALAGAGANVLIHGRSAERAAEVAGEVAARGAESHVILADLADSPGQDDLATRAWDWRPLDIWVNAAGADVLTGEAANWPFETKLARLWDVDVLGTMRLSRAIGARMKERGRGAILNLSWDQAAFGMGGDSGEMFAAIKGAVAAFSLSLARSLAPHVRVNCVAPGWIKTAWGSAVSAYWDRRAQGEALRGRWGAPEDVANVARFLVSPQADFITGQVWNVNGGFRGEQGGRDLRATSSGGLAPPATPSWGKAGPGWP